MHVFENVQLSDFRFRIRSRRLKRGVEWQVLEYGPKIVSRHSTEAEARTWIIRQIPSGKRRDDYIAISSAEPDYPFNRARR